ncbi:threonine--tRNA ligase [Rickettsia endosymbiont of Cardiosporidium cionae]|uniref:threonine--tRNA ligase n=1 Tax=Rickettsia endosymbiont of Cardiosporidium cionae TaxID=2777155 RepID=UPI001894FB34|nr:threonine--tRNA ligase [Rickettsia endosymbiont of Cardiosporidium cionae]KAF8818272.1 threonine--tRNA ligase [Rickettsia endosymbiont of Cardiosporidium cionae]
MIKIILDNNEIKHFNSPLTGLELATSISKSLEKNAFAMEIDGKLYDLNQLITEDSKINIITIDNEKALDIIRHDTAHLLASAVKEIFPEVQVTIGPTIKDGFYYDFATSYNFKISDLQVIEKKMHQLAKKNDKFCRQICSRKEAIELFKKLGEDYKLEIIDSIDKNEPISLYKQGDFIDLCRGPHGTSTAKLKYFKLTKIAAAYWRGDNSKQMLQRIYGTAWSTQEQLDNYLYILEESAKRDHRKIGKELSLFHFQDEAQGIPFWHHNGYIIYKILQEYLRKKLIKASYIEVKTPGLADKKLWEDSGHWDKFQENMFILKDEDKTYALKPMNCPCHIQIFNQTLKSYKELPIRMSEFGSCYRKEASGALHGLLRVKNFVQDDAHIFCEIEHINSETVSFCNLLTGIYEDFGFKDISINFSDRPSIRAGSDEIWDSAESALKSAILKTGLKYQLNKGDGAFYGPKLDFILKDAVGRHWQCGTLQVDFILPSRLNAKYINKLGKKETPVILHRAVLGSIERFIGILIEEFAGKFPIWLAPVQVAIATITNAQDSYAREIYNILLNANIRTMLNINSEKINYKIRQLYNQKIPIIAIIGKQEALNNNITLRSAHNDSQETISIETLINRIKLENTKYL